MKTLDFKAACSNPVLLSTLQQMSATLLLYELFYGQGDLDLRRKM